MSKNRVRRPLRLALFGMVLGLLAAVGLSAPAFAFDSSANLNCPTTSCSGFSLPENYKVCTAPFYAASTTTSVELNGQVGNPAVNVRWHFFWNPNNVDFAGPDTVKVFTSDGKPKVVAVGTTWDIINSPTFPQYQRLFPGYFEACMNNYETGTTVDWILTIGPGQF